MDKTEFENLLYDLTHLHDEEGNDTPGFCFATDLTTELGLNSDVTEEEVAKSAIEKGYTVYKIFPGETMEGGLVIFADGAEINMLNDLYNDFYGEAPESVKMKLDDDGNLAEVEDELEEEVNTSENLEDKIRKALDHSGSQIHLFEFEPHDDSKWYIEKFDDKDVDFSHIICYDVDKKERMDGKPVASFMISGGENGSGDWDNYLDDLRKVFNKLKDETGYYPLLYKVDTDIADDVWNGYVFLYDKADYDLDSAVNKLGEALLEKTKKKSVKVRDPNAAAMWGRTRSQTFKPKKGKGSFKRHAKHKTNEDWFPIDEDDLEAFKQKLNELGYEIEYVYERSIHDDDVTVGDAKDIHIQIYSRNRFDNIRTQEDFDNMPEIQELIDLIINFNEKYRPTYSIGFGGINIRTGVDHVNQITAGIDLRCPWINPEDIPTTTIRVGSNDIDESKSNELTKRAKKHKKTDKKGARGWFVNPNAGNVELNIAHFNNVAGNSSSSTISAPAGLGEDVDTSSDGYYFTFENTKRFIRRGMSPDGTDERGFTKWKTIYYTRIPETAYVVRREDYMNDKLLRRRKNKEVFRGVKKFFEDNPTTKICVISAVKDLGTETKHYANTYRVLAEQLQESYDDYYVVSDGKNPRHSSVYSEGGREAAIEDAKSRQGYWEVLHYVKGKPEKIWPVDDVNEAVEKHETLNPKLWDENNQLKPEVREKILEIVKEFTDGLEEDGIKFKIKDIVLVGSNCSYNYNDKSDLDVHIRMDTDSLECPDDLYPLLYSAYRSLFNNKMDIDFYGIPVEIYVETDDTKQMNDEPLDNM